MARVIALSASFADSAQQRLALAEPLRMLVVCSCAFALILADRALPF